MSGMSYLYAFCCFDNDDLTNNDCNFVLGWHKIACFSELDLDQKQFFLKFYGKQNLRLRFEYA